MEETPMRTLTLDIRHTFRSPAKPAAAALAS
jgi:hypothetical protein